MGNTFDSVFEEFVYKRTYSRYLEEEHRREEWDETVNRYCDYIFNPRRYRQPIPDKVMKKIRAGMQTRKVLGSMRLVWSAGPACDSTNVAAYNCSGLAIESPLSFGALMLILMAGAGVGYSVERKYTDNLPEVKFQKNVPVSRMTIEDSKFGWQNALNAGMSLWFDGRDIIYEYSDIRPKGAPLKTFGGRASGPDVLRTALDAIREMMLRAQGRRLTPLECHDICVYTARAVIVGGVRRAALISLSDIDDHEMRDCKVGIFPPERFGANNSAVYYGKPNCLQFMEDFAVLGKSGTGERGIFNLEAARRNAPHRRKSKNIVITNPCLRGDMSLLTATGYHPISDLVGQEVNIVNKDGLVSKGTVWHSGEKEIVELRFGNRDVNPIYCTADHSFMVEDGSECKASELRGKKLKPYYNMKREFDKYDFLAGFIQGDGCTKRLNSPVHLGMEVRFGEKDQDVSKMFGQDTGTWYSRDAYTTALEHHLDPSTLPTRRLPSREFISPNFLSGLYSANGCVIRGYRVAIKSTCYDMLSELRNILDDWFGIESYITTNKPTVVSFANGDYLCKESYDLNISQFRSIVKFAENISFAQSYKQAALEELISIRNPTIRSIHTVGVDDVYDFSEPKTNWGVVEGFISHNCGEVTLRNKEFCNLASYVIGPEDDFHTIQDRVKTAVWIGVIQSTFTDFPNLSETWAENCMEERLVGASFTGLLDNPSRIDSKELELLKKQAVKTAREAAEVLGINMPAATTCVKPNGTTSALVNSAAGIHPRWAPYYLRNVQISKTDPLYKLMAAQGAPCFDTPSDPSTAIISFPIKSPDGVITRHDLTALDQLEIYKKVSQNYTEMSTSCTIYCDDSEWIEVAAWVHSNFDIINGLSFFPKNGHAYEWSPYQDISEIEYVRLAKAFPKIDFSELPKYEEEDQTIGAKEYACSAGGCDI